MFSRKIDTPRKYFSLSVCGRTLELGHETKIMGVLNVTPDSFSDGGEHIDPAIAELRALKMQEEGAHIIDIGGESTRPGAKPLGVREEIRRIQPVLRRLRRSVSIPLSVDTYKGDVARMALDEGASIVNDIYGLRGHKGLAKIVARYKAGLVLMHMQGTPKTMQKAPRYRYVLREVAAFLRKSVGVALAAGVDRHSIIVDPGFGFGKKFEHNLELLSCLDRMTGLGYPLLVGVSRKSFIGTLLDVSAGERLYGSLGAAAVAINKGAHILRAHDVLAHRQMTAVMDRLHRGVRFAS